MAASTQNLVFNAKDVDFDRSEIIVREGKGKKDRVTMLPATLVASLRDRCVSRSANLAAPRGSVPRKDSKMDTFPATITSDDDLGDWFHHWLVAEYGHESEAWAIERVARIADRLNAERAACPVPGAAPRPLRAEILWVGAMNAFAVPGRFVYLTRELLQRAATDEPIALVLAHEMAHHDLGHVRLLAGGLNRLRGVPGNVLVAGMARALERGLLGPERETAADAYALDLCVAARFDAPACLDLFGILEAHLLDWGDLDGVFGPDAPGGVAAWVEQRLRGYPSVRARRAALVDRLRDYGLV